MRKLRVIAAIALAGPTAPATARATYPGGVGEIYYAGLTEHNECGLIRAVRPDHPGARLVLSDCLGEATHSSLAFTPDGRELTLLWDRQPAAMTPDGFDRRLLDLGPGAYESRLSYAPDGRRVAFARDGDVWTARADGSRPRRLVRRADTPAWSPAGGVIAVIVDRRALWLVDARTGRRVRRLASYGFDPDFSPDGRRVAYAAADGTIHVIGVDGRGDRPATALHRSQWSPSWSPDSRRIAYAELRRRENGFRASVCVVAATGGPRRCIAALRGGTDSDPDLTVVWRPLAGRAHSAVAGCAEPFARAGAVPAGGPLATGDFDGDGRTDVVAGGDPAQPVQVLRGDGAGGLVADPEPVAGSAGRRDLAVGDFTGDGRDDVAVLGEDGTSLRLLVADAAGRLAPGASVTGMSPAMGAVTAGDLDGDGRADLLLAQALSDAPRAGRLRVYLGDGAGGLRPAPPSAVPASRWAGRPVIADFDRDGHADVAQLIRAPYALRILAGDGTGRLRLTLRMRLHDESYDDIDPKLATGDFDGNGLPDLAAPESRHGDDIVLRVLLDRRRGGFRRAGFVPDYGIDLVPAPPPSEVAVADFNGDGRTDIAWAGDYGPGVALAVGDGRGGLVSAPIGEAQIGATYPVLAAQLDGADGADLLAGADGSTVALLSRPFRLPLPADVLQIRASAAAIARGHTIRLSVRGTCAALLGQTVTLYRRLLRGGAPGPWLRVAQIPGGDGDAAGFEQAADKPSRTAQYYWRTTATPLRAASRSSVVTVQVTR